MRQYRKIDIYVFVADDNHFEYRCSTTRSKTLKAAKARFVAVNPPLLPKYVKCAFAEPKR